MTWNEFIYCAIPSIACWLSAGTAVWFPKTRRAANVLMVAGIVIAAVFIVGIWTGQERPPLRTTGETRLWYSFFLSAVGFAAYRRFRYPWLLTFAAVMATMFTTINLLKPEIHSEGLMPALQSIWFVPHVVVYMLSYAMFAAATLGACIQLHKLSSGRPDEKLYGFTDGMVYAGFALLTFGMLMGMVWAKVAWGHYWTWDPKETWALSTALSYLVYIHMRRRDVAPRTALWMLPVAFVLLMITWLGVNYLPAAQSSIHVY